jgi:hypothetical protein
LKNWFLAAPDIPDFDPACIANSLKLGYFGAASLDQTPDAGLAKFPILQAICA